jgi:hypothetical protein
MHSRDVAIGLVLVALGATEVVAQSVGGWDPGIHKRCAWTVDPDKPKFYSDTTNCPGANVYTAPHWQLSTQSEGHGQTCPTPLGQSFLINGPNSPVNLAWFGNGCNGYTVDMQINFGGRQHPCGDGYFTHLGFGDNAAGYHPSLATLSSHHKVAMFGHGGEYKAVLTLYIGNWGGKDHRLHVLLRPNNFWEPDNAGDACIRWVGGNQAGDSQGVMVKASCFGIPDLCTGACTGEWKEFWVNWRQIYDYVRARGKFENAPPMESIVGRPNIALEVKNEGSVHIQHREFWLWG